MGSALSSDIAIPYFDRQSVTCVLRGQGGSEESTTVCRAELMAVPSVTMHIYWMLGLLQDSFSEPLTFTQ